MTWTYDPHIQNDRDRVRLAIGDTDIDDPQLQDEEIEFLLEDEPDYRDAAVTAAETLAARYARKADYSVDGEIAEKLSQIQGNYERLADRLRRRNARRGISPFVGGQSKSAKRAERTDADRVQPSFVRDMMSEPGTSDASGQLPPNPLYPL